MAKKNFETALAKLEKITEELENGELNLETSLKKFDEGVQLISFCNEQLQKAQARVEILLKRENRLEAAPFAETNTFTMEK
ncbi:MAG: exodeoxyribonuclease VII small subunit [Desulfobacterales bacterium]|nr:MAG: exodeoxyribonuclease VII small subunit [Desulfobacterales bacterium]